jgi:hypothetical protein
MADPRKTTAKTPLTPLQHRFVIAYTSQDWLYNGMAAAKAAGYSGNDRTLASQANQAMHKPNVWSAIERRLNAIYNRVGLTIENVLRDLEITRQGAIRDRRWDTAARCSELHGKYLKMFVDRVEHIRTVDDATTDELVGLLSQLVDKIDGFPVVERIGRIGPIGPAESGDVGGSGTSTTH